MTSNFKYVKKKSTRHVQWRLFWLDYGISRYSFSNLITKNKPKNIATETKAQTPEKSCLQFEKTPSANQNPQAQKGCGAFVLQIPPFSKHSFVQVGVTIIFCDEIWKRNLTLRLNSNPTFIDVFLFFFNLLNPTCVRIGDQKCPHFLYNVGHTTKSHFQSHLGRSHHSISRPKCHVS